MMRFYSALRFVLRKGFFCEISARRFVHPSFTLGYGVCKSVDGALIDGVGPDGIAATTLNIARRAGALQSGYLYHYAFAMLLGIAGLTTWFLVTTS